MCAAPQMAQATSDSFMEAPFGAIASQGELGRRLRLSYNRLELYTPEVALAGNEGWPGDREGRALLGQVLTAQAMGLPSHQADALLLGIAGRLNARGYLGPVLPAGVMDEQVLAGHSWLLRGLIEYHKYKHDDRSLRMIDALIKNLLLPARGFYERYPISAANRPQTEKADGTIVGAVVDGWRLSSDIGCAFIMLDGATSAHELAPTDALESLIQIMIKRFAMIDLQVVGAQTHASLSAARAILRFARLSKRNALVAIAEKVFTTYKQHAMTDHFANDNWFGKPRWTEGCAIIDSFDVAMLLWQATENVAYLEDAQNIYFNGIGFNQRPNGGFGCDTCPGSNGSPYLAPYKDIFEAFACCSMRGGEGMAKASVWQVATKGNDVALTTLQSFSAKLELPAGALAFSVNTAFPITGQAQVRVHQAPAGARLQVFMPSWVDASRVVVKLKGAIVAHTLENGWLRLPQPLAAGQTIDIKFPITLRAVESINASRLPGVRGFRHGPLVMGALRPGKEPGLPFEDVAKARVLPKAHYKFSAYTLVPITGLAFLPEKQAKEWSQQILFPLRAP